MSIQKTSLYNFHHSNKALMVNYHNWEMPLYYDSISKESISVRNSVGMFDVSHMSIFILEGIDSINFLQKVMTKDVRKINDMSASYSLMLNENGKILDDLIIYRFNKNKFMLILNASQFDKNYAHLKYHSLNFELKLKHERKNIIALQGPESTSVLKQIFKDIKSIKLNKFIDKNNIIIYRGGYTGSVGYEIICSDNDAYTIWSKLNELNVKPCGLGARDCLRLEACLPLYGHEIDEYTSPKDVKLDFAVDLESKSNIECIGFEAYKDYNSKIQFIKIQTDRGPLLREGTKVISMQDDQIIAKGAVTSGVFSAHLNKNIALAKIAGKITKNTYVEIRNKKILVEVIESRFI